MSTILKRCQKHEGRFSADEIAYEATVIYIRCIHCNKLLCKAGVDYPTHMQTEGVEY